MKLYFAEAYTLKEDNWAAEIIGYSAEQLPNNEPSRSCPKNRQDRLKEKGPHRGRIINRYQVSSDRSSERFPVRRAEISDKPRFSCEAIGAYKDSWIPRPPAAQAADKRRNTVSCCRPCFGLRILSPKEIAGTVPFAKEHLHQSSRRYPDLAGDKKRSDRTI